MKFTRRNFIQSSGMAVLTATLFAPFEKVFGQTFPTDQFFAIPPESAYEPLNYLKREHFETFVNTYFQVQQDNGRTIKLQLLEVTDLTRADNQKRGYKGDSFSLLFQDSKRSRLPQNIYEINHESLGGFSLFLVPIGLSGNRYEAIINRINS